MISNCNYRKQPSVNDYCRMGRLGQLMHVLVFLIWSQSKGCRNHPRVNDHCSETGPANTCISSIPYMVAVFQSKGCRNHLSMNDHYSQTGSAHTFISSIPYMVAVSHLSVKRSRTQHLSLLWIRIIFKLTSNSHDIYIWWHIHQNIEIKHFTTSVWHCGNQPNVNDHCN